MERLTYEHISALLQVVAGLPLLIAVINDIAFRRIPRILPSLLAMIGLLAQFAVYGAFLHYAWIDVALSIFVVMSIFTLTGILWRNGMLGGGGAKLIPAALLILPPTWTAWATTIVSALLMTLILAAGLLIQRWLIRYLARPVAPAPHGSRFFRRWCAIERWTIPSGDRKNVATVIPITPGIAIGIWTVFHTALVSAAGVIAIITTIMVITFV